MRYTVTDKSGNWLWTGHASSSTEAENRTRDQYPFSIAHTEDLVITPTVPLPDQRGFYIGVTALDKLCQTN